MVEWWNGGLVHWCIGCSVNRVDIRRAFATTSERGGVSRLARATWSRVVAARAAKKWMVVG